MSETKPRVLVVEDEPQIRRFVCDAVRRDGCTFSEAGTARQGLDEAAGGKIDLVILDLGLPDMNGIEFIRDLRTWSHVPILILSARTAEQDKVAALDAGADDYLSKPFGVGELLARVRALIRRHGQSGEARPHHRFGDVVVDLSRRVVSRNGVEIHLTQIEYRLLAVMLANSGKVMTHRHLMQEVWGPGHADQGHYLRVYVGRLRQKLETDPAQPQHFLTETGVGYRFQS
ncbi:response regulator [Sulfurisoma sediminicola]|uniref:Two-component system KDP operon response regulator KdpE n=1 Tax=Sulfurisoma sediminicola TaxID=1381557 RepID=A0A497XEB6_9PROT|nr:response regulator [Sulfurisoma sediminicola]RLJ65321.1 two-component system KDP operon response regulator KdpE [Sulfurisoma sediminicola]